MMETRSYRYCWTRQLLAEIGRDESSSSYCGDTSLLKDDSDCVYMRIPKRDLAQLPCWRCCNSQVFASYLYGRGQGPYNSDWEGEGSRQVSPDAVKTAL